MPSTLLFLCVLITSTISPSKQQPIDDALGELTLDELEMLEDFELKMLRDFVKSKGKGSVSKAIKDEMIDLTKMTPQTTSTNTTGLFDLGVIC
jgi:hypothetical protein